MNEEETKSNSIKSTLIFILLFIIITILYCRYIGTRGCFIKEFNIKTTALNEKYDGLKIVQISDIHYGTTILEKELTNIVNIVNKQNPDIIVFTGDLIDKDMILNDKQIETISSILNKLEAKVEILGVKGNHDYFHDYFDRIIENTQIEILNNTYKYVYIDSKTPIVFVGLDDYMKGAKDYNNAFSYLNDNNDNLYTILLLHEPDQIDDLSSYNINLAFAGHSHLGQIRVPGIGAIYTPLGSKKYYDETYNVNGTKLYINNGLGTSMIKFRFLNRPSIYLYRFETK